MFSCRMSGFVSVSEDRCIDRDIRCVRLFPCRAHLSQPVCMNEPQSSQQIRSWSVQAKFPKTTLSEPSERGGLTAEPFMEYRYDMCFNSYRNTRV